MRFIHAADLHIDSSLSGLRLRHGGAANAFATATRSAFRNLIDHALSGGIDFVVIAGDVFDGDWADYVAPTVMLRLRAGRRCCEGSAASPQHNLSLRGVA